MIFPYDDITKSDIASWLDEISAQGMIITYQANGETFYQIKNFLKHQIINRPSKNCNPKPSVTDDAPIWEQSQKAHGTIMEQSLNVHGMVTEPSLTEREEEREKEGINAFCPAPKKTGAEPEAEGVAKPDHVVYEIPIVGGGKSTYPITQPMIDEWQLAYPGVDVDQAIRECRQWNIANPTRRKTSSGIARHIVSWLQREKNRGGVVKRAVPGMMKGQSKTYEHNVAAIAQAMFELKQEGAAK